VLLISDSDYVCDGISKWLSGWKTRGWKTSEGDPVKNMDLWMQLNDLLARHRVNVSRPETQVALQLNARVDQLANKAATTRVTAPLTYFRT
jgi:ribonuclease HI